MLGIPLRYLLKHPLAVVELVSNPVETWTKVRDVYVAEREQRGPQCQYEADNNWERWLHARLGAQWPCQFASAFQGLWPEVVTELEGKGIRPGPESFGSWNDGDAGLARAVWCLIRHLRPK